MRILRTAILGLVTLLAVVLLSSVNASAAPTACGPVQGYVYGAQDHVAPTTAEGGVALAAGAVTTVDSAVDAYQVCSGAEKGSCAGEVTRGAVGIAAGAVGGHLLRRALAAKSVDDVGLYRHVSPGELADIGDNGFRPGSNSLGGKWFAESGKHASEWGRVLNNGEGSIVKVRVPGSFADQLMRLEKLDGIGPARYVEPHQLDVLNRFGREVW